MAINGNYMHSTYSSFVGKYYYFMHYFFFLCLRIEIFIDSNLFKCLIAIKCFESRVETLKIFYTVKKLL